MKRFSLLLVFIMVVTSLAGCAASPDSQTSSGKLNIVTTTTMLADLARVIGGDKVEVTGLMGPGIDPHLYKASAGDVTAMQAADMVVYSGLHLEGKMGEIFENLEGGNKTVVMIAKGLPEDRLVTDSETGTHDPHIWFDVNLWQMAAANLLDGFKSLDADNASYYQDNYDAYQKELTALDEYVKERIAEVPERSRILITAHDAFNYFGKAYSFEVRGLQGISTASEAGTGDVKNLADFIVKNKIKAIFVESSVPKKNVEALQEAVKAQGFDVAIGGELFSDSLGSDMDTNTYLGTVKSNVDTIVDALK